MKLMHAVRVLAGLGLAGAFALGSVGAAAQTAAPGAPKIGSSLIGKLQGPEIIRDAKAFPKTFKEAPTLAALVKDGKLPAVDRRLPEPSQLLVVKPLDQIGKYGGNWRRAFTGPADHENGNRIVSADKILTFDYTGTRIMPSLARDWKVSDDGKTTTIYLRKGAKWSDGKPLTADDFIFWYEDIYLNKNIVPTPFLEFQIDGKPARCARSTTTRSTSSSPSRTRSSSDQLAGSTAIGAGLATRGALPELGRCLRAGALPQAVPAEVLVRGGGEQEGQGPRFRQLGVAAAQSLQLGAQPRAAGDDAVEDRHADQHADLGDGAQPVLLGRRHRRQPAALHRQASR